MATLTELERRTIVDHLGDTRGRFLAAIGGLNQAQWTFQPDAETWSVGECADHVVVVENRIYQSIIKMLDKPPDPERCALIAGKERLILKRVPDRSVKVKVPVSLSPTGHGESPQQLALHFQEVRDRTVEFTRSTAEPLHHHAFPHGVFGDLDSAQWLLLISLHTERHLAQMDEVKANPEYPA